MKNTVQERISKMEEIKEAKSNCEESENEEKYQEPPPLTTRSSTTSAITYVP